MVESRRTRVKVNKLVRIVRSQRTERCSAGHYWLTLRRIGFPTPDHIERLDQKPANQARATILSCPYCAGIIDGHGNITCFGGRRSYYLVFYAIANIKSRQPRASAAWDHLENCIHCQKQCRDFAIFQQLLHRQLEQMTWRKRRRVKKDWTRTGILA